MDAETRLFFAAEVQRLTDRLFGTALRLTRNREDAEDLVADTVAKAWAKLPEMRDPRRFDAWIQRILANTFVSDWRRRRASPEVPIAGGNRENDEGEPFSLFEKLHQPFLLWWTSPEESVVNKLLRDDMENALDNLPDAFRIAVVLVDVQGYSYAEAAGILEVPVGTVRSRLNRARAALQRSFGSMRTTPAYSIITSAKRNNVINRPLSCEEVLHQLFAYLDRELQAETSAEIERHLETCRGCFSRAEFERKLKAHVKDAATSAAPESLRARLKDLIEKF